MVEEIGYKAPELVEDALMKPGSVFGAPTPFDPMPVYHFSSFCPRGRSFFKQGP
jgi:hypothetical protein